MKNRFQISAFLLVLSGSILLSACGTGTVPATEVAPSTEETAIPVPTDTVPPAVTPPSSDPAPASVPTVSLGSGGTSFSADVLPILQANCTRCHGTSRQSADLKLNTYANLMTGSENGPVVVPGDAANSSLVELIVSGEMPKRADRLSDEEIQIITDWVNAGAPNN